MRVDAFIAFRYLLSKRRIGFVTIISLISVLGLTIGVAALLFVLSVFNGFNGLVTSILITFDPHVRVESKARAGVQDYDAVVSYLESDKRVSAFAPFVTGKALLVARNMNRVITVKGVDPERIRGVSGLGEKIVLGSLDLREGENGIVLGMTLADRLGSVVGDTVAVVSPAGADLILMRLAQPLIRRYRVVGIYESNNKDYDAYYAYMNLSNAQKLFQMKNTIHGLELRLHSLDESNDLKEALLERFGDDFRVYTWFDLHRDLYSVMRIERWIAYIILSLIIGVASFNLLGSLTMAVIEKTRDIGVLRAIGAKRKTILQIFLFQGVFVGIVGAVLGVVVGLVLVYLQLEYRLFPLDPTVYIIPAIPVEVHLSDVLIVPITAIAVSALAALYPARRAADQLPVESIRWE